MSNKIRILCVGAGHMGRSHALAYHRIPDFEICGIVTRSPESRGRLNAELGGGYEEFGDYHQALAATQPDAVSISTYPDTHAPYAEAAFDAGCHVFIEKPLAETVEAAEGIVAKARGSGRKLVIGYILRHPPSWVKFIEMAGELGKPLVMRMNLNQQSSGANWKTHKALMSSISPIVDCGVHYVDVMCQMTRSKPVRVSGLGARLSDELPEGKINYGHLQVTFEDGSELVDELGIANAHPFGARPFGRAEYIKKFKTLTEEILDPSESARFLDLVQRLPNLSAEEVVQLNPVAPAGYLVENTAKGIF